MSRYHFSSFSLSFLFCFILSLSNKSIKIDEHHPVHFWSGANGSLVFYGIDRLQKSSVPNMAKYARIWLWQRLVDA